MYACNSSVATRNTSLLHRADAPTGVKIHGDQGTGSAGPDIRLLGVTAGLLSCSWCLESLLLLLTLAEKYIPIMGTVKDKAAWQADKSR